jgi:hypothetical protein
MVTLRPITALAMLTLPESCAMTPSLAHASSGRSLALGLAIAAWCR